MRVTRSVADFLQPLERKLPLLIAALLCAVVASFGWMVNRELRTAFESAAGDRLTGAAQRIASMLTAQTGALKAEVGQLASDTSVIAALARPSDAVIAAARARLGLQRPSATPLASRALFDRDCHLVMAAGPLAGTTTLHQCGAGAATGEWIQPILVRSDTTYYSIVAPVLRATNDTLGYVVQVRQLGDKQSAQALTAFMGRGSSLLIGNAIGAEVWTDLARAVPGPPRSMARGVPARFMPPDGHEALGVALDIAATPWIVDVQMPLETAHSGQYEALRNLALVALACVLVGAVGARMV
ncbi:MAG: hypothetical protein ABIY52_04985, partial [Gemmatimonadaceae bacterium]